MPGKVAAGRHHIEQAAAGEAGRAGAGVLAGEPGIQRLCHARRAGVGVHKGGVLVVERRQLARRRLGVTVGVRILIAGAASAGMRILIAGAAASAGVGIVPAAVVSGGAVVEPGQRGDVLSGQLAVGCQPGGQVPRS